MTDAREIAEIVRAPSVSVEQATRLIEQYARIVANNALIQKDEEIIIRLAKGLNSPLPRTYGENCARPSETVTSELR